MGLSFDGGACNSALRNRSVLGSAPLHPLRSGSHRALGARTVNPLAEKTLPTPLTQRRRSEGRGNEFSPDTTVLQVLGAAEKCLRARLQCLPASARHAAPPPRTNQLRVNANSARDNPENPIKPGEPKDDPSRVFNPATDSIAGGCSEQEEIPKMTHVDGKLHQDRRTESE